MAVFHQDQNTDQHPPEKKSTSSGLGPSLFPNKPSDPAVRASRQVMQFAVAMLVVLLTTGLPLPWNLLGLIVAVVAIVLGIRALVSNWRAGSRGLLFFILLVSVGLTGMMAIGAGGRLAFWDAMTAHQNCVGQALTVEAQDQCVADYKSDVEKRLQELGLPSDTLGDNLP